jgi:uncharacterized phiE125 gp8 family phage protein
MKNISAPASLSGAPLAELKRWLSITTTGEDELLTGLIAGALSLCERFTGIVPLKCDVRETLPATRDPCWLAAVPHIALLEAVAVAGLERRMLDADDFELVLAGDGRASFALTQAIDEPQVELHYLAGQASEWEAVDEGLRQGVIRHAAHLYRQREENGVTDLPASVAAIWRPWRKLRL